MTRWPRTARTAIAAVVMSAALGPRAVAQAPNRAIEFEDYGFDRWLPAGARGSALAAFGAAVRDATALAYNPAGLARIRRVSASATVAASRASFDSSYDAVSHRAEMNEVALQYVGAAFPVPVLRGSLVPAVGVQRSFTASLDLAYRRFNAPDLRDERLALRQSGATYAYHVGAGTDLSPALSAGAALILLSGGVDRVRQFDTRSPVVNPGVHRFVYESTAADVGGYGARFGFHFYPFEYAHLAVSLTTPMVLDVRTTTVTEELRQVDNDVGTFTRTTATANTEYRTPYRLEGALAVPASRSLLFTGQVGYADWSQATIGERRVITPQLESVLREVVDWSAGAEWSLARWPLRVRVGFAHARGVARFLEADRIDNDRLERIVTESPTRRYSLGAAFLLRDSMVLDAAVVHARGERAGAGVSDARETTSVSVGCGYWF